MSTPDQTPDYDLIEEQVVTTPEEIRAIFDPFNATILELLLERAATITELAAAIGRPKSTVAYHVGLLVDVNVLKVVRTRRVRGREERFYGRVARLFYIGQTRPDHPEQLPNYLTIAADESVTAHHDDTLRAVKRDAWISDDDAEEFLQRVYQLANEYSKVRRSSHAGKAYTFVAALYPSKRPRLKPPD